MIHVLYHLLRGDSMSETLDRFLSPGFNARRTLNIALPSFVIRLNDATSINLGQAAAASVLNHYEIPGDESTVILLMELYL